MNDPILEIYYRVSERDAFTLLGTVTNTKVRANVNKRVDQTGVNPIKEQRYQFTKVEPTESLPEFNEIQLRFVSKNGFSVIGAWFEYSYITRNVLE